MNISTPIGSYLSRPVVRKNNERDNKSCIIRNQVLTNATFILGASIIGLKLGKMSKNVLPKVIEVSKSNNEFSHIIDKTKSILKKFSPQILKKIPEPVKVDLPNVKKQMFDPTIPGSKLSDEERLSRIFVKLKDIWTKDGKVLPEKIDEILTNHVGENRVREIPFYTDERRGILFGRKKSYRMRSGNIFVLEAHNGRNGGVETRCYWAIGSDRVPKTKDSRLYLSPDGIFEPDQYFSRKAHLPSNLSAIEWVNEAKRGG